MAQPGTRARNTRQSELGGRRGAINYGSDEKIGNGRAIQNMFTAYDGINDQSSIKMVLPFWQEIKNLELP